MKPALFLLASLAPLMAAAVTQDEVNAERNATAARESGSRNDEELRNDLRLAEIFGYDVQSVDGRRIGRVRDVTIGKDGGLGAVSVEFDQDAGSGFALMQMDWEDLALKQEEQVIVVSLGPAPVDVADPAMEPMDSSESEITARQLIGMPVDLSDRESFGRVADVLVDRASRQPSALLVETGGATYALPMLGDEGRVSGQRVRYRLSGKAVTAMGDFDSASRR